MASRRNYLDRTELEEYADITITDTGEADDRISIAEEIIDSYAGFQDKFLSKPIQGRFAAVSSTSVMTLETTHQNVYDVDFFKWCEIEIIGGTGASSSGRRTISSNTRAGVITLQSALASTPDTTSFYKIYQLGKFPRACDVTFYSLQSPSTYYKQIPEAVKRAVAAQVEFMINMGDNYFSTDKSEKVSESIGDYSYENSSGTAGITGSAKLIAPKAKILLKGIRNITGKILV